MIKSYSISGDNKQLKIILDEIYYKYNKRKYVSPDPLQFLYNYEKAEDREIVGLIASSLAYGRVAAILKAVKTVLDLMGSSPYDFMMSQDFKKLNKYFDGFKYRFNTGSNVASIINGAGETIRKHGSLGSCLKAGLSSDDKNIIPATGFFLNELRSGGNGEPGFLLPHIEKGSACKRLFLYFRWMIRNDEVDPGGWEMISPSKLIVPLDTHMYKTGIKLGFSQRKQANMKAAIELSEGFKNIDPNDPVRYDFVLTRPGIWNMKSKSFFME